MGQGAGCCRAWKASHWLLDGTWWGSAACEQGLQQATWSAGQSRPEGCEAFAAWQLEGTGFEAIVTGVWVVDLDGHHQSTDWRA